MERDAIDRLRMLDEAIVEVLNAAFAAGMRATGEYDDDEVEQEFRAWVESRDPDPTPGLVG